MNPVDLIASRHKELRKAREEIGKVQAALDRERARLTELQAGIAAAEQRDRKALGDAIVSGSPIRDESDALRADVEQQQRRIDALLAALSHTQQNVAEVVRQNAWSRDQMREVEKARLRYAATIEELERARDVFADETGALAWLFDPEGRRAANQRSARRPDRRSPGKAAAADGQGARRAPCRPCTSRGLGHFTARRAAAAPARAHPPRGMGVVNRTCRVCRKAVVTDEQWRAITGMVGLGYGTDSGARTCAGCVRQGREQERDLNRQATPRHRPPSRPPIGLRIGG